MFGVPRSKEAKEAVKTVFDLWGTSVYLKGGHSENQSTDYFFDGHDLIKLHSPVLKISSSHGTGCRLSSAICAGLSKGQSEKEAAVNAKNYVYHCLNNCLSLENGLNVMNTAGTIIENITVVEDL